MEPEIDDDDLILNNASSTLITEVDVRGFGHTSGLLTNRSAEQMFVLPQTVNATAARDALLRVAPFASGKRAATTWKHIVDDPVFQRLLGATYHHFAQCFRNGKFVTDRLYDLRNSQPLLQLAHTMAEMYISFESSRKKILTRHLPEVMGYMVIHCLSGSMPRQQPLSDSQRLRLITFDWCFEVFSGLRPIRPMATHAWFFAQQPTNASSTTLGTTSEETIDGRAQPTLRARYTLNHSPLMKLFLETVPYGISNHTAVTLSVSHPPDRSVTTALSSSPAVVVSLNRKPLPSRVVQTHLLRASKLTKRVMKESRVNATQTLMDIKGSRAETARAIRKVKKQERQAIIDLQAKKRLGGTLPALPTPKTAEV